MARGTAVPVRKIDADRDRAASQIRSVDPAVYLVPGRRGEVVVTTGALARLGGEELDAAQAHERAHARGKRHRPLAPAWYCSRSAWGGWRWSVHMGVSWWGSALGLAAMTAVAASCGAGHIGDVTALTDGFSGAFLGAAGIAAAGALLATVLLRVPSTRHTEPAPAEEPATAAIPLIASNLR